MPDETTPMIEQYWKLKEQYPNTLLFFRMGDFYEMFFEDAERASKVLDIALTSRSRSDDSAVPLCGVRWITLSLWVSIRNRSFS